jgi:PUA domain protein
MSKIFQRHSLREKEAKSIIAEFSKKVKILPEELHESKKNIEVIEIEDAKIYLIKGKPLLAEHERNLFPTLFFNEFLFSLPKIVVDMGAVSYVCNGADIMAPGIVRIEGQFNAEDFILIVDEHHTKPLAIATSLFDSQASRQTKHGKIAKNLHFIGDKIWKSLKDQS